jgi:hypothetical protein
VSRIAGSLIEELRPGAGPMAEESVAFPGTGHVGSVGGFVLSGSVKNAGMFPARKDSGPGTVIEDRDEVGV